MADYRLPMDADGVKYHGVVDEDGKFPGQVLYGLDKNGRLKPVNVDDEGNVLTRVTGSIVEERIPRQLFTEGVQSLNFNAPENATGVYIAVWIRGVTGTFSTNEGLNIWSRLDLGGGSANIVKLESNNIKSTGRYVHSWGVGTDLGDAVSDTGNILCTPLIPQKNIILRIGVTGTFSAGEGFDLQGTVLWF